MQVWGCDDIKSYIVLLVPFARVWGYKEYISSVQG